MKKYNIILQEGWMGDTLWACNIIKNLSDMGYEIIMFHKWKFMRKLIDLFEIYYEDAGTSNPKDIFAIRFVVRARREDDPYVQSAYHRAHYTSKKSGEVIQ